MENTGETSPKFSPEVLERAVRMVREYTNRNGKCEASHARGPPRSPTWSLLCGARHGKDEIRRVREENFQFYS